eukprot:15450659-Alexandrium_andersonii.AAC.1
MLLDSAVASAQEPLPSQRGQLKNDLVHKKPAAKASSSGDVANDRYANIGAWGRVRISANTQKTYLQHQLADKSWKLLVNIGHGLPTEAHHCIGWNLFEALKNKPKMTAAALVKERDALIAQYKDAEDSSDDASSNEDNDD